MRNTHMHVTLSNKGVKEVLGAIWHHTQHHGQSMKPNEIKFLTSMEYRLREQGRTMLTLPQAEWLLGILDRA